MTEEIVKQIEEMNRQADELNKQGKLSEALDVIQRTLDFGMAHHGEEHPEFAKSLHMAGNIYYSKGEYKKSESFYLQAMEIRRKTLGEEHSDFAASLNNLGILYKNTGNYAAAEQMSRKAIEIWRKTLGEEHANFGTSLNNLGILYVNMGNYAAAEPLYRQSLEIWRKALGAEHPRIAISLNNLGNLFRDTGNYAAGELMFRQAMDIQRIIIGEEHPEFAMSLNNLGNLFRDMGNHALAEPLYKQAMEIYRKLLGEEHPDFASIMHNLGSLYSDMGNYAAAESLIKQSTEIRRKTLGEEHPELAESLNNLGNLYGEIGNYTSAESLFEQAIEIWRKTLGEEHPEFAQGLINMGRLYGALGKYAAMEPLYKKTLEIQRKAFGEEHPAFVECLLAMAKLYSATQRQQEALDYMLKVMNMHNHFISQIFSFAAENQRMGYLKKIQPDFDAYLSLVFRQFRDSRDVILRTLDLVFRRKAIGAEALAAQRDAVLGGKHPELKDKLRELTAIRMQVALKTMKGPGPEGKDMHDKLIAEWTQTKEKLESELARNIPEMSLEEQLQNADRKAIAKALPRDSVLVEFVKFNEFDFQAILAKGEKQWKPARYLAFVMPSGKPENVTMIDLGEAEHIDNLIIEFRSTVLDDSESHSRSGASDTKPSIFTDGNGADLHNAVFDPLIESIRGFKHVFISPDSDLSRLPFEALPAKDTGYIIDDYHISYLSVGRDVLRFGTESSGTTEGALVAADPDFDMGSDDVPKAGENETGFSVARGWRKSRDFERSSLKFERLPGTRPESDRVSSILRTKPWLEDEVLEGKLKSVHSPLIMHLATHGFFLENQKADPGVEKGPGYENPLLRSGLALAGANTFIRGGTLPDEAEDGILTAEDVSGLDLLGTQLVVLSACDTGLGEVRTGEGVFGLRRAFMLAGAKTLIMSLWKITDLATPIFMGRFYENLLNRKLARDESLREAQLYLRRLTIKEIKKKWLTEKMIESLSRNDEHVERELDEFLKLPDDTIPFDHPFYWGAFICQGDPSPI